MDVAVEPNTAGLVLEGVCGAGKSTILGALIRNEVYLERGYPSSLVLSEHHTQRVLEPKQATEGLAVEDNVTLLRRHVDALRALERGLAATDWAERGRSNHRLAYLLERFHLTHACHYDHVRWEHVRGVDEDLAGLGCKLCLLRVDEAAIEERAVKGRADARWQTHLSSVGPGVREVVEHYVAQQERFSDLVEASSMASLVVDTTEKGISEAVAEVSAFWLG